MSGCDLMKSLGTINVVNEFHNMICNHKRVLETWPLILGLNLPQIIMLIVPFPLSPVHVYTIIISAIIVICRVFRTVKIDEFLSWMMNLECGAIE
ncbi:hypothetical protein RIF29_16394 [Crotalaria pallida]|uniref:Uncharacterized protein n=1 Tax=Crotalaria pallida TaxID=3830 RepID=A0AAN9FNN6_CROPI